MKNYWAFYKIMKNQIRKNFKLDIVNLRYKYKYIHDTI